MTQCSVADTKTVWSLEFYVVLFLSLIFCKQEEKLLFFGSVSGCTCLILIDRCLVDIYTDTIPIRLVNLPLLVNLERFPVKIKKHYLLGELHPVTHIEHFSGE